SCRWVDIVRRGCLTGLGARGRNRSRILAACTTTYGEARDGIGRWPARVGNRRQPGGSRSPGRWRPWGRASSRSSPRRQAWTSRSTGAAPSDGNETPVGDLFALANAVAAVVGGAVTIEDARSNVLAYSNLDQPIDEPRRQTILGRRVPEDWTRRLRDEGVFRDLWASDGVIRFGDPDAGARMRLAVAIRAGTEVLGSIWVMEGDEPASAQTGPRRRPHHALLRSLPAPGGVCVDRAQRLCASPLARPRQHRAGGDAGGRHRRPLDPGAGTGPPGRHGLDRPQPARGLPVTR